jgi:hypothetical protein
LPNDVILSAEGLTRQFAGFRAVMECRCRYAAERFIRAGQFVNLMPIFGAGLAFAVLGEGPTMPQVIGASLVLSGIAFVEGLARDQWK